jgi:integrase
MWSARFGYVAGQWLVGNPKTDSGRRTVTLPAGVAGALADHLDRFVPGSPDALVFGTASGSFLSSANWGQTFRRAVDAVGLPPVRPHELRHTGATLAAATGATTKELMRRLGHATPAAALIYQHAADERDGEIARALEARMGSPFFGVPERAAAGRPVRRGGAVARWRLPLNSARTALHSALFV